LLLEQQSVILYIIITSMGRFSNSNNKRGQRRMVAANKPPKERPQGECLFDRLPAELVGVILSFVPPTNLPSVLRVCHTWHAVLQSDEPLWYTTTPSLSLYVEFFSAERFAHTRRRWCAQLLDKRLVEMKEQPTWRAHFRQCVESTQKLTHTHTHTRTRRQSSLRSSSVRVCGGVSVQSTA
jgi:hypothetical protein